MKKMRGVVDPISLGFLIAIFGATATLITHKGDKHESAESNITVEQTRVLEKNENMKVSK